MYRELTRWVLGFDGLPSIEQVRSFDLEDLRAIPVHTKRHYALQLGLAGLSIMLPANYIIEQSPHVEIGGPAAAWMGWPSWAAYGMLLGVAFAGVGYLACSEHGLFGGQLWAGVYGLLGIVIAIQALEAASVAASVNYPLRNAETFYLGGMAVWPWLGAVYVVFGWRLLTAWTWGEDS